MTPDADDLRPEYDFHYLNAKRNRFAKSITKGGRLVVLDPDLAAAFPTAEAVNAALREYLRTHQIDSPHIVESGS